MLIILLWHVGLTICRIVRGVKDAEEGTITEIMWMTFTDWEVGRRFLLIR